MCKEAWGNNRPLKKAFRSSEEDKRKEQKGGSWMIMEAEESG